MNTLFAGCSAAAFFCASAALSADLPSRSAAPPISAPPAFTWTGFYVGANAGYSWNKSRTQYGYSLANTADFADFNAARVVPQQLSRDSDGFLGGGQLGYNHQIGQFVLGVEADLQYLGARRQAAYATTQSDAVGTATVTTGTRSSIDWLGTARGRAGVAFDRVLMFATGGLAFGRSADRTTITAAGFDDDGSFIGVWSGQRSGTRVGWSLGGGVEYALTQNLTLKAEYLYYDLGNARHSVAGLSTDPDDEFLGAQARRKINGSVVRAGLNWKFSTY
jgi:outer membrane immunogenic protein